LIIPVHFCYYCSSCFNPIHDLATSACSVCEKAFSSIKDFSYFVHFSVRNQIKSLFARKDFFTNLQYRFSRVKLHESNYEDIYDGKLYKELMTPNGILSSKNNISLTWNVDGLPLFKSSKFSLWPLYFIINELRYKLRTLKENMIIAGLWFGERKPSMNIYLKPIIKELMILEQHGVEVQPPMCGSFVSNVVVLAGTCDLPAKCLVLNCIQFNGEHGCSKCLEPGITLTTSARGHTHVYPYNSLHSFGHCENRTKETHYANTREALEESSIVKGVKGPSWLMKLKHYDIIRSTSIDYMHCVLLGVMKLLMSLWFNTTHNHEQYYIGRKVGLVDKRLCEINPPSIITRRPRGSEHFKFYKASEYRSFLLYYSLPVLHDILPQEYWNHYACFVISIFNLMQQSVSEEQLEYCERALRRFCCQFENLYGKRYMTANVHLLLHLTQCVRELGPLWAYSCFHFESQNGILKSLVHGTQHVEKQIITSFSYHKNLPSAAKELIPEESVYMQAFGQLHFYRHLPGHNCTKISDRIYLLGKSTNATLTQSEINASVNYDLSNCVTYSRIKINDILFHASYWNKGKKSNSAIAYHNKEHSKIEYGLVQKIVYTLHCNTVFLLITQLKPHSTYLALGGQSIPHIRTCNPPSDLDVAAIEVTDICSPCVYMSFSDIIDKTFISVLVNVIEKD